MKKTNKTGTNSGSSSKNDSTVNERDNTMRKSRRRLIQIMVAGGVVVTAKSVPSSWSRPVVKAVTLPAHAQTSGQLITLGNNGNFQATNTESLEQAESLLASGVDTGWTSRIIDTLVEQANAQDDTQLLCDFAGCAYIEYYSGANTGRLFISVLDNTTDNAGPRDLVMNFTDGEVGAFMEPCLDTIINGFVVNLVNDNFATLGLVIIGEKTVREIDLVSNFVCEPVLDGAQ